MKQDTRHPQRGADEPAHSPAIGSLRVGQTGARTIRPSHQRILDAFALHGAMTPDEVAVELGRSVFYCRPRCSELRAMGLLHPTGETRENATSGLKAAVLNR